jgi:hypothetical protein
MFCHEHDVNELCFSMLLVCNDSLSLKIACQMAFVDKLPLILVAMKKSHTCFYLISTQYE